MIEQPNQQLEPLPLRTLHGIFNQQVHVGMNAQAHTLMSLWMMLLLCSESKPLHGNISARLAQESALCGGKHKQPPSGLNHRYAMQTLHLGRRSQRLPVYT